MSGQSLGLAYVWFVRQEFAQLAARQMNGKVCFFMSFYIRGIIYPTLIECNRKFNMLGIGERDKNRSLIFLAYLFMSRIEITECGGLAVSMVNSSSVEWSYWKFQIRRLVSYQFNTGSRVSGTTPLISLSLAHSVGLG